MNQPTFAIVVVFRIKTDFVEAFRQRVLQQATDSVQLEEGCHQFDVLQDEQDNGTIVLYETYQDAAAFKVHRSTPHFDDFNRTVSEWVESKQVHRLNFLGHNL